MPNRGLLAGLAWAAAGLVGAIAILAAAPPPETPAETPAAGETLTSTDQFASGDRLIADREKLPGAALYGANCALCHGGSVAKAPNLHWLELMPPAAIVNALTIGVMAQQGKTLTERQKLDIAEYITRQPLTDGLPRATYAATCTGDASTFDMARPPRPVGWGHDPRRFVDDGIDAADLPDLELKWAYAFPNATRARSQPAIGYGAVFVGSEDGRVYAFDLKTGCARWTFQAGAEVRTAVVLTAGAGAGTRPMAYFGDIVGKLYAVDALTGKLAWVRRIDDHPSATLTGTPLYHDGRLYVPVSSLEVIPAADPSYPCCTFRGQLAAVDAATGAIVWRHYAIPQKPASRGLNAAGIEQFAPSGAPIWVNPTLDPGRGLIYVGTGENYSSPADANSDAILAIDLKSGKRVWQQQTVKGDAWNVACMMEGNANCPVERGPDFDHSSSILLIDLPGGRQILVTGHKNGLVYGRDPDRRGALLWSTRVGRGSIQGGVHFGMAAAGTTLYVPVNDMNNTRNGQLLDPKAARPGMHAIDMTTGKLKWSRVQPNVCGPGRPFCDPGISAAVTAVPGAVIAGHLDGHVRAYAEADGKLLWDYPTARPFTATNDMPARGGGMSGAGAAVGAGHVAMNSGYGLYFHEPGNVFLVFGAKDSVR